MVRIRVPKGTQAIWLEKAQREGSFAESEQEMLLPRGMRFRVVDVHDKRLIGMAESRVVIWNVEIVSAEGG
jgi:hypothetical protein